MATIIPTRHPDAGPESDFSLQFYESPLRQYQHDMEMTGTVKQRQEQRQTK